MDRQVDHSFIPSASIIPPIEKLTVPDALEIIDSPKVFHHEIEPVKDTRNSGFFYIKAIREGRLFISKQNHVLDLEGNKVPMTLLITKEGETLFKHNLGLMRQVDKKLEEGRKPQVLKGNQPNRSGEVVIIGTNDGNSVAVKRFYRYQDGRKLHVGGLEQAEACFRLNEAFTQNQTPCRMANIFLASQDVMVMENIEDFMKLTEFLSQYPVLQESVIRDLRAIDEVAQSVWTEKGIIGLYEPLLSTNNETGMTIFRGALKHLFIDSYDASTASLKYVMIDPNV